MTAQRDDNGQADPFMADTRRLVADISDEGLFERLAASVLRISNPLYEGLCDTGTNVRGRTIADPADGVVYAKNSDGERFAIIAQHTITQRSKLRSKWLDSRQGDVARAMNMLEAAAGRLGKHKRRLVLTCSGNPGSSLVTDIEAAAVRYGIEIDVWEGSRIADVLDLKSDGQRLRERTFGKPQQRLSRKLTQEIGRKMVEDVRPRADAIEFIGREIQGVVEDQLMSSAKTMFLVGASGVGKSVLCYALARALERAGGVCLVLGDQVIESALSLEEALSRALKAYAPALSEPNMEAALESCWHQEQLLVWVEDINRAASPTDLLRKLVRWTKTSASISEQGSGGERRRRGIRYICPIWPGILEGLSRNEREAIDRNCVLLEEYSLDEGSTAVSCRASRRGIAITRLEAQEIAEQLNRDPLLIGLVSEWDKLNASQVIGQYIDDELRGVADSGYRKSELFGTLKLLVSSMLAGKSMSPLWGDALSWLGRARDIEILRLLVEKTTIVGVDDSERLGFRHDRVRDYLFSSNIAEAVLTDDFDDEVLQDPYFARVVGNASLAVGDNALVRAAANRIGSLAKMHAFAAAVLQDHHSRSELYRVCWKTITSEEFRQGPRAVRFAANAVLAQLEGQDVLELLRVSPEECFAKQEGMARNGDIRYAASFCYTHEPHMNSPRRDRVLEHVARRRGAAWVNGIGSFLSDGNNKGKGIEGALFLAGELGREELVGALKKRWKIFQENGTDLTCGMLFAAIACSAGRDNEFADQVAHAWAILPRKDPSNSNRNPRYNVSEYGLRGGLRRHENDRVVDYLLSLPERIPTLEEDITTLMRGVDHPKAVEHVAKALAAADHQCNESGSINIWAGHVIDGWGRWGRPYTRTMGAASRRALRRLWSNREKDRLLRKRAFELWSARMTSENVLELGEAAPTGLESLALAARLRHGDQSAIPELAKRIDTESGKNYWLQFARFVGTEGLERSIELLFEKRRKFFLKEPDGYYLPDDCLSELLADRDDEFALQTILANWDQVGIEKTYTVSLLYFATPESLAVAEKAIQLAEEPTELLQFIDSRMGIKFIGRPGLKRLVQVEGLLPYMQHLSESARWSLWHACNERGWFDWRKRNLDQHIQWPEDRMFARIDEQADFKWMDQELATDQRSGFMPHFWIEERSRAGMTGSQLVDRAQRYASIRQNLRAHRFFAEVISEIGTRADIEKLDMEWAKTQSVCLSESENAAFSVKLRRCD